MMNPAGCSADQLKNVLAFCGFDCIDLSNGKKLFYISLKNKTSNTKKKEKNNKIIKLNMKDKKNKKAQRKQIQKDPNSPFAVLEKLL